MNESKTLDHPPGSLSIAALRKLPESERRAILEAQVALAEKFYRHDHNLTAFEAFGKDDLSVDSTNTAAE